MMRMRRWSLWLQTALLFAACGSDGTQSPDDKQPAVGRCGDGVVQKGEACDSGGASAGCDADCTLAECGDGTVNAAAGEACDDAGASLGCDADCSPVLCGDGTPNILAGEACDTAGDTASCDADCTTAECGDDTVNGAADEDCDDGTDNSDFVPDACRTTCRAAACRDGVIDTGETCDDGDSIEGNGCNNDCAPSATELWTRTYNGSADGDDVGYAVAVDVGGNILVAGYEATLTAGLNAWVRKYDPGGGTLWTRTYDGGGVPTDSDGCYDVAVDGDGNVLVAGWTFVAGEDFNVWIRKYDPDGGTLWTRIYDGPANDLDTAVGIAADADGNVLVAGYQTVVVGYPDVWVRKYDPNGGVLWTRLYNGADDSVDVGTEIAVDPDGNVLVVGDEYTLAGDYDIWVRKYDPDGGTMWTRAYNGPADGPDTADGIAAGSDGSVVISARETVIGQGLNGLVRKYDSDGGVLWTRTYVGPAGMDDAAVDTAIDADGSPLVVGWSWVTGQNYDGWIRKYDPDGNGVWTRGHNGANDDDDACLGVAVAPDRTVVVAGTETVLGQGIDIWVRKYTP